MDETEKAQLSFTLENEATLRRTNASFCVVGMLELEARGDYEAARELLATFWSG